MKGKCVIASGARRFVIASPQGAAIPSFEIATSLHSSHLVLFHLRFTNYGCSRLTPYEVLIGIQRRVSSDEYLLFSPSHPLIFPFSHLPLSAAL